MYRGIILFIDGLTNYVHLEPASFRSELADAERPASETARNGLLHFRDKFVSAPVSHSISRGFIPMVGVNMLVRFRARW